MYQGPGCLSEGDAGGAWPTFPGVRQWGRGSVEYGLGLCHILTTVIRYRNNIISVVGVLETHGLLPVTAHTSLPQVESVRVREIRG